MHLLPVGKELCGREAVLAAGTQLSVEYGGETPVLATVCLFPVTVPVVVQDNLMQ